VFFLRQGGSKSRNERCAWRHGTHYIPEHHDGLSFCPDKAATTNDVALRKSIGRCSSSARRCLFIILSTFFGSWVLCFAYISEEMSKLEQAEKALQAKLQEKGK
jgi:hypothetical protein